MVISCFQYTPIFQCHMRSGLDFPSLGAKGEHPFWIWGTPSIHIHTEGMEAIDKELIQ